jgi:hypothetical protein
MLFVHLNWKLKKYWMTSSDFQIGLWTCHEVPSATI